MPLASGQTRRSRQAWISCRSAALCFAEARKIQWPQVAAGHASCKSNAIHDYQQFKDVIIGDYTHYFEMQQEVEWHSGALLAPSTGYHLPGRPIRQK